MTNNQNKATTAIAIHYMREVWMEFVEEFVLSVERITVSASFFFSLYGIPRWQTSTETWSPLFVTVQLCVSTNKAYIRFHKHDAVTAGSTLYSFELHFCIIVDISLGMTSFHGKQIFGLSYQNLFFFALIYHKQVN
ncbi:hypothetical protein BDF20DRAFT_840005 [Mycotypha africana]|uniref:uncharacterized protein n=1 Tax=Mycotypha africana TaxID=64632 RepID=UPI0023001C29|nr:uncharacterized protein BDF20DRAFT_840005 [Mycotypha africana]KAI8967796.1 hypothetical protein BDF20DRAFT_840005 [Mycotypha africana]